MNIKKQLRDVCKSLPDEYIDIVVNNKDIITEVVKMFSTKSNVFGYVTPIKCEDIPVKYNMWGDIEDE